MHSPASANFQGDWPTFVTQIGTSDCAVIGINDYFSVAGYKELRRILASPIDAKADPAYRDAIEKLSHKTLLPVIECRMTNVVIGKKGIGPRINFHIIFSDEVDPDNIETFIRALTVDSQIIGTKYSDSTFLLNDVSVDFTEVCKKLKGDKTFENKHLIWMPYDEYGGIGDIDPQTDKLFKQGLVNAADILGSANKKQSDFFLWKHPTFTEADFRGWFGRRKPCIKGSDSHSVKEKIGHLKDENSKITDRRCWIKADPTFRGLCQIINEPEDRIWLGTEPPKLARVRGHSTYFLSRVKIGKTATATTPDAWFDCDIALNHDMVAVIGNKGSGKSALADILALAGDTDQADHFSFLEKKKFREKKLAQQFEVTATWADGTTTAPHNLQTDPDPNSAETVRYISQSYLEHVCTETSADESSAFQHELRSVIFSHIGDAQKLGKDSLEDLIDYKTEEVKEELARLRSALKQVNADIVALEQKAAPDFKAQINELLKKKQQELEAHTATKPALQAEPQSDDAQKEALAGTQTALAAQNQALLAVNANITATQAEQKTLAEQQSVAGKLETRITNIEGDIRGQKHQAAPSFTALGLNVDEAIALTVNKAPLLAKKAAISAAKSLVDEKLSPANAGGLFPQQKTILDQIELLKDQLDAPNRQYQDYLQQLAAWEARKQEIEGAADKPDTLRYLEAQLAYIEGELTTDLEQAFGSRRQIAQQVHASISIVRAAYADLFTPVQQLIAEDVIIKDGFKLSFASAIMQRGFRRDFFERYISQGVNGSFCGKEPGEARLTEILEEFDFNDGAQVIAFAEEIDKQLKTDFRSKSRVIPMLVGDQLRKHTDVKDLYDFLWSFEYLFPEYSLKLDGKDLSQLSPGERGALLLVFYLLVDRSDKPIIVDQPEENLDNQTVFHLLIPVIKKVKQRRQIIMVTHSPNIAVVCDAEQIIHATIDRTDGNRIIYTSGSIEDVTINKRILDVLEGTRPAFDNRDGKYYRDV